MQGTSPVIHVDRHVDGVRLALPRRAMREVWWMAAITVIVGMVFASISLYWVSIAISMGNAGSGPPLAFRIFFAAFGLPFLLIGLTIAFYGLSATWGHTSILITNERLRTREHFLGLSRGGSRPRSNWVHIERTPPVSSGRFPSETLVATFSQGKRLTLCFGYATAVVDALVEQLVEAARLTGEPVEVRLITPSTRGPKAMRKWVRTGPSLALAAELAAGQTRPPAGSDLTIETTADGLSITAPPQGIRRASRGLFVFSILWLVFITIFTGGVIAIGLGGGPMSGPIWIAYLVIGVFWTVGIVMLIVAIASGRRSAIFDVVGETLLITSRGLRGVKQREWKRDSIRDILCPESGVEVNNVPLFHLRIVQQEGRHAGYLTGRSELELEWVAERLRNALRLGEESPVPAAVEAK